MKKTETEQFECMDNFAFDVTARSRATFELAMKIATADNREAVAYAVSEKKCKSNEWLKGDKPKRKTLILYWAEGVAGSTPLPHPLSGKALVEFCWDWLRHVWEKGEAGEQPDHDGDNSPGYRVFNEDWGHINDRWEAFAAIQPVWAMHGK